MPEESPADASRSRASFDLWRAVAEPLRCPLPENLKAAETGAARFADLVSPALAQHLLAPLERRLGRPLVDPGRAAKGILLNRFHHRSQVACARRLHEADIAVVYLKGFASAHTLYDVPEVRVAGDLDALVRAKDLPRVIALLEGAGFGFRETPGSRWGFVATSSYVPFVSADGSCNLDLHTAPDSDPLDRALTAEQVFAHSRETGIDGMGLRTPGADHALVIALSNISKDRFGPFAAKKLLDAARLVARGGLDWDRIADVLRRARLAQPGSAALALLADLGFEGVPARLARAPTGAASREYRRVLAETRALYSGEPGPLASLRRELFLGGGWPVALRRNARRLRGLMRPARGVPILDGARKLHLRGIDAPRARSPRRGS